MPSLTPGECGLSSVEDSKQHKADRPLQAGAERQGSQASGPPGHREEAARPRELPGVPLPCTPLAVPCLRATAIHSPLPGNGP